MDAALGVAVLILASSASSIQISLTCADTARGSLKPMVNCALIENTVVCGDNELTSSIRNVTSFVILEQVNISQTTLQFCLGLESFERRAFIRSHVGFNSTLAVGVVTVNRECWKTQSSSLCLLDVTVLEVVLELGVFKYYHDAELFWNFESALYGTTMRWFQSLNVEGNRLDNLLVYSEWISNLQNTSIRELSVYGAKCGEKENGFVIKDMPYLQTLELSTICIRYFHRDTFTGTPNLEAVELLDCGLTSLPNNFARLSKLKSLNIRSNSINGSVFIEKNPLSQLHNLEYLHMGYNAVTGDLGKFPVLHKLIYLQINDCGITALKRDAFRNISLLELLDLNDNLISIIHDEAFLSLRNLQYLILHSNQISTWPVLYYCSLLLLDLRQNQISDLKNPCAFGTTINELHLQSNNISDWGDVDIFSCNMSYVHDSYDGTNNTENYLSIYRDSNANMSNMETQKKWVKLLIISSNKIFRFTDLMLKSMDGLESVVLFENPFDCRDCTIPEFQKWINTTKTKIIGVQPLVCSEPYSDKYKPITAIEFDLETCLIKGPNYWIIAAIPLGIVCSVFFIVMSTYFRFRPQIVYMLHLYSVRKQKSPAKNNCNFDAFVCYSCSDRRFVLKVLVPLLENSPQRYKLCLHERDFMLGSHIIDNIVEAIEHSRKTIMILSPHFIDSKWCNWELEMANSKMFDNDKQFIILIQVAHINRGAIPRHLKFYMDTRTFLTWSQEASERAVEEMGRRLKKSLGRSIFQRSREQACGWQSGLSDVTMSSLSVL